MPSERSIATILFTDIVGSTERAAELGDRGWRNLLEQHNELVRRELSRFQGREIATAGDGFLAVLDGTTRGILCASAIRDAVQELGLQVRCGLHMGQVEREAGGDIGGISVHVGARVAAEAKAGEVLVSSTVRDAELGSGFGFDDRGQYELKGVPGQWRLYAITSLPREADEPVAGMLQVLPFVPIGRSIAVLPFENRSSEPETEYFNDGVMVDVLTALSKIRDLRVISRTSTMRYKGTTKRLPEIAADLNVGTVLEGSVRRDGNRVRITAQLIDARTDKHLWAESYDRELESIFDIQSDVAAHIASALETALSDEESERITAGKTKDLDAYDLYLRGRECLYSMGRDIGAREESERAIEFFREALRLDPQYALAHVGLSTAYEYLELHLGMSALETALAEANKAIELDSNLAEGYAARSRAAMGLGQMELALTDSRRAIELDPNHASATRIRMLLTYWTGRLDESLIWSERLRSLEPTVGLHPAWVGMLYFQLGMYDAAIRELRKVEESEAGNAGGHSGAVYIHMARGELDKAAEEARKARALQPDSLEVIRASIRLELRRDNYDWVTPYIEEAMEKVAQRYKPFTYLGYAYQKTEERDKAEKVLREAEQYYTRQLEDKSNMRPVSCVHLLQVHLVRGEIDEAVRWFGEWIDAGGRGYEFLQIDPIYDDLWEDERALALLEGVKTEVAEMRERVEQEDI